MRIPLVHWSDYSIEFAAALGIFVISLIGLLIVLIIVIVEFVLGVYKKVTSRTFSLANTNGDSTTES